VHVVLQSLVMVAVGGLLAPARAQGQHQQAPVRYSATKDENAITRLDARIAAGELDLAPVGTSGRLVPLLQALGVPASSQTLVFSKTSLQRHRISLRNPRALYFGPDVYVGWVPGAAAIEVAAGDPRLGFAFYRLAQDAAVPARFERDDSCLSCHASARTDDEPGLLLRSVFADGTGDPVASAGETAVITSTPLAERWGGWIVTGAFHGAHRGNGPGTRDERGVWRVQGRQANDLHAFVDEFDASAYPVATSDIGALLALEQQVTVHNLLVRASIRVRVAAARDAGINEVLDEEGPRPATVRLLDSLAREIAAALLLAEEPSLGEANAAPDAAFAEAFAALWPRDANGQALGRLDLSDRTFTLPMSPMVHSPAFAALPELLRERVIARLRVICDRGRVPGGVHLSTAQRTALRTHLAELLPGYATR